jgi:hypothetical protein
MVFELSAVSNSGKRLWKSVKWETFSVVSEKVR